MLVCSAVSEIEQFRKQVQDKVVDTCKTVKSDTEIENLAIDAQDAKRVEPRCVQINPSSEGSADNASVAQPEQVQGIHPSTDVAEDLADAQQSNRPKNAIVLNGHRRRWNRNARCRSIENGSGTPTANSSDAEVSCNLIIHVAREHAREAHVESVAQSGSGEERTSNISFKFAFLILAAIAILTSALGIESGGHSSKHLNETSDSTSTADMLLLNAEINNAHAGHTGAESSRSKVSGWSNFAIDIKWSRQPKRVDWFSTDCCCTVCR